jgi:hypothetical protein
MSTSRKPIVLGLFGFVVACAVIDDEDHTALETDESNAESAGGSESVGMVRQALTGSHKLCACVSSTQHTTTPVPDGWDQADCASYCSSGSSSSRVGCLFDNHLPSFASSGGSGGGAPLPTGGAGGSPPPPPGTGGSPLPGPPPSPNCGW